MQSLRFPPFPNPHNLHYAKHRGSPPLALHPKIFAWATLTLWYCNTPKEKGKKGKKKEKKGRKVWPQSPPSVGRPLARSSWDSRCMALLPPSLPRSLARSLPCSQLTGFGAGGSLGKLPHHHARSLTDFRRWKPLNNFGLHPLSLPSPLLFLPSHGSREPSRPIKENVTPTRPKSHPPN